MVEPADWPAMFVFRQNRSFPSAAGTLIARVPALTVKMVPVSAFSGRPPSEGGLNRGSRQVPVHGVSSTFALSLVSLKQTRVR